MPCIMCDIYAVSWFCYLKNTNMKKTWSSCESDKKLNPILTRLYHIYTMPAQTCPFDALCYFFILQYFFSHLILTLFTLCACSCCGLWCQSLGYSLPDNKICPLTYGLLNSYQQSIAYDMIACATMYYEYLIMSKQSLLIYIFYRAYTRDQP